MTRVMTWIIAAAVGLLIVTGGLSYMHLQDARVRALRSADQAWEVERISRSVLALIDRPALVLTQRREVQQLSGLVEQTALAVGIDQASIKRIDAQDARRVGKTPYYRLPTRINIEGVTMPMLLDLLARLTEGDHLTLADCRIAAPHGEVVGSHWHTEFTLAYTVYEPAQDQTRP